MDRLTEYDISNVSEYLGYGDLTNLRRGSKVFRKSSERRFREERGRFTPIPAIKVVANILYDETFKDRLTVVIPTRDRQLAYDYADRKLEEERSRGEYSTETLVWFFAIHLLEQYRKDPSFTGNGQVVINRGSRFSGTIQLVDLFPYRPRVNDRNATLTFGSNVLMSGTKDDLARFAEEVKRERPSATEGKHQSDNYVYLVDYA